MGVSPFEIAKEWSFPWFADMLEIMQRDLEVQHRINEAQKANG